MQYAVGFEMVTKQFFFAAVVSLDGLIHFMLNSKNSKKSAYFVKVFHFIVESVRHKFMVTYYVLLFSV